MTTNFSQQGSYQIKKGETVFLEGSQVNALIILLQGRMDVYISSDSIIKNGGDVLSKCYKIFTLEKGIFIGANDIVSSGKYSLSYRALEDCTLYVYPYQSLGQIWSLVSEQKDYGSFIINSIYTMASNSYAQSRKIFGIIERLRIITENLISFSGV
jgi:CRP-like cAMP-binding protein